MCKKVWGKKNNLLYCVSKYPSEYKDFNFKNISILKKDTNVQLVFLIILQI